MAAAEDHEIRWVATAATAKNADEKRTLLAGMIAKNGLKDRYSMDILTVEVGGVEEHRLMLVDSKPGEPPPDFLRDPAFVMRRSREHKRHVPDDEFYEGTPSTAPAGRIKRTIRDAVYCYGDEEHTLAEWARISGIPYATFYHRLVIARWPIGEAITRPVEKRRSRAG